MLRSKLGDVSLQESLHIQRKRVFLSSPTMHGDELKYIKEAFDTNWVAPLGANVDGFE